MAARGQVLIYLDSSALVKLVRSEAESPALGRWLGLNPDPVVSSALARTEVVRAVLNGDERLRDRARSVLAAIDLMPMTNDLLDEAAALTNVLRTLDAIHLATACRLREDLHAFVAYDKRLLTAAAEVGLLAVAPGADG